KSCGFAGSRVTMGTSTAFARWNRPSGPVDSEPRAHGSRGGARVAAPGTGPVPRSRNLPMANPFKPLEWALGRFSVDMGIDLGTASTLVCVRGRGIILNEPSVVALKKETGEVLLDGMAVGNTAKAMLGKTPGSIEA